MKRLFILAAAIGAVACANDDVIETASSPEPAATIGKQTSTREVEALVREFSGDSNATVRITRDDGADVCGVATVRGTSAKFYADLVDEEAFIATGNPAIDAVIASAC